jgi:heat-inducible transcriptional repressor
MFLDDRKRRILQAIIDDYIDTAEPIGSRTIARRHELGLSSATIRNEMSDLEEMGYLAQPHTSAGRIPSDKGYRLYVDQLMRARDLTCDEVEAIRNAMEMRINELSQLVRQASAVMSRFTGYTSMAMTPQMRKSTIKAIQVVPIEADKVLVIVVTNTGVLRNNLVKLSEVIRPDMIIGISNVLNEKLNGLTIEQINLNVMGEIEQATGVSKERLIPIYEGVADCIRQIDNPEVYIDGTTNIFNYPEFMDVARAKEFLSLLDEKHNLSNFLKDSLEKSGISVKIGSENDIEGIQDCSLITANYNLGDMFIGAIGIIGPTRMEYSKVISSMNYMRKKINQEISRLLGEIPD